VLLAYRAEIGKIEIKFFSIKRKFEGNAKTGVQYFWPVLTLEWFPIAVSGCPMIVQSYRINLFSLSIHVSSTLKQFCVVCHYVR